MTAGAEPVVVAEDRRAVILAAGMNALWELEGDDAFEAQDASDFIDLLDRLDERDGVVRVNLLKQRSIEAERDRLRGVVHAMLQAFERGGGAVEGPNGTAHLQSIWVPESMVDGWRQAAAGGR